MQTPTKLVRDVFRSAAENLAADEALLDWVENEGSGSYLRLWEGEAYFVVLGHGKRLEEEVLQVSCLEDGVAILRRSSGGGTVVQGPGCLNYALVFSIRENLALETVVGTNSWIMERHRRVAETVSGLPVARDGCTDLAVGRRKFSGNAQRRKRNAVLFHGTFMHGMDLGRIGRYLREPAQQPSYRARRRHEDFVMNLPVERKAIEDGIRAAWNVAEELSLRDVSAVDRVEELVRERYSSPAWNRKF